MVLIYVPEFTHRAEYTLNLVFRELLGLEYKITTSKEEFSTSDGCKINYSKEPIQHSFFIYSHVLLFETDISYHDIQVSDWEGVKVLFGTHKKADIPFDIFSATFYMVSRYEEYLPSIYDLHGRFDAHHSLAYKNHFLHKPVVNIWANKLKELLTKRFPSLIFQDRKFNFINTIDVDNAFAYKAKGFARSLGGLIRSAVYLNWPEATRRLKVIAGLSKDPYENYIYLRELEKKFGFSSVYFFLFGDYGQYDKNIPVYNKSFKGLIKSISDTSSIGIHPTYASNNDNEKLSIEVKRLSKVINREILKSRQHYLKMNLPLTYRNLLDLGIREDYTMGFASEPGFRAGICTPFFFYDLDLEIETKLKVFPFEFMDGTFRQYLKFSPEDAKQDIEKLVDEVKQVNGTFISIWHNDSVSDEGEWKNWQRVYEHMINYIYKK